MAAPAAAAPEAMNVDDEVKQYWICYVISVPHK